MLQLILMIIGIVIAVRRPRLSRLTPSDYPHVSEDKFEEWKAAQLAATDAFLWATWGSFFIMLFLVLALNSAITTLEGAIGIRVVLIAGFIIGLVAASKKSRHARKLREEAGIDWPKKHTEQLEEVVTE